ncbi:MAG: tetratricopeptide repeat protein [Akkermansiaceae bacterium]|nr:tetratricopeptide repeat protein [Akkermansiaceae bacterium]
MKPVLYLLILLGATLLAFDLAKEVKDIEVEPAPEPTRPVRPQDSGAAPSSSAQAPDGHAEAMQAIQQQVAQQTAAIGQSPDDAGPYIKRAELYAQMRQFPAALADLDKAATLAPGAADVFFQRGYVMIATGQTEKALADFSRVLEITPAHTKARLYRAIIRYRNKSFQPALDDCLALLKHDPTFHDAHITASRCYMELNNKAKAIAHLETYIAQAKDPDGIREARRLIELWNQQEPGQAPGNDNQPNP